MKQVQNIRGNFFKQIHSKVSYKMFNHVYTLICVQSWMQISTETSIQICLQNNLKIVEKKV
jgi:hypothetical protein